MHRKKYITVTKKLQGPVEKTLWWLAEAHYENTRLVSISEVPLTWWHRSAEELRESVVGCLEWYSDEGADWFTLAVLARDNFLELLDRAE
jgi:hypothetical protein